MRASQIAPVYVDDPSDCAELFLTFMSYAKRVCEEEERPGRKGRNTKLIPFLENLMEIANWASVPGLGDSCTRLRGQLADHLKKIKNGSSLKQART